METSTADVIDTLTSVQPRNLNPTPSGSRKQQDKPLLGGEGGVWEGGMWGGVMCGRRKVIMHGYILLISLGMYCWLYSIFRLLDGAGAGRGGRVGTGGGRGGLERGPVMHVAARLMSLHRC